MSDKFSGIVQDIANSRQSNGISAQVQEEFAYHLTRVYGIKRRNNHIIIRAGFMPDASPGHPRPIIVIRQLLCFKVPVLLK
jgi:hypothetical protein